MGDLVILGTLIFFLFWFVLGISMLINPKFFVDQTVFWNKWFLNLIGYEADIKPKSNASMMIRVGALFCFLIFLIGISMGFDFFMMLFR